MILCPLQGRIWRITQRFSENPSEYRKYDLDGHNGIDYAPLIRGTRGVIVYAPHDGYVTLGDEGKVGYGKYVMIISDPYGFEKMQRRSDLAHLDSFMVKNGQFVFQGEPIGVMGNTGNSTGIHLHQTYKQMQNGKVLNYDKGYKGAIDIAKHTCYWSKINA